jgi:hypothetical protein
MTSVAPGQSTVLSVASAIQMAVNETASYVQVIAQTDQAQVTSSGQTVEVQSLVSASQIYADETIVSLEFKGVGLQGPVGEGFPSGGTTGQVLTKNSDQNYDASWSSGPINQITNIENILAASGVLANKANMIDGSVVYYDGESNEFRADNIATLTSLTDGGNF